MSMSSNYGEHIKAFFPRNQNRMEAVQPVEATEPKPGKEVVLARSAADVVLEIETRLKADIEKEVKRKHKAKINKAIEDHYTKQAEKMFRQIWRECRRRTGHTYQTDKDVASYSTDNKPLICTVCNHPIGRQSASRELRGFRLLGEQLRAADQRAGTEWIPRDV